MFWEISCMRRWTISTCLIRTRYALTGRLSLSWGDTASQACLYNHHHHAFCSLLWLVFENVLIDFGSLIVCHLFWNSVIKHVPMNETPRNSISDELLYTLYRSGWSCNSLKIQMWSCVCFVITIHSLLCGDFSRPYSCIHLFSQWTPFLSEPLESFTSLSYNFSSHLPISTSCRLLSLLSSLLVWAASKILKL